jgi:hypothetical protein
MMTSDFNEKNVLVLTYFLRSSIDVVVVVGAE